MNETLRYYRNNAEEFVQDTLNVHLTEIQDKFLKLLPCGAKILDLGCGSGRDAVYFSSQGFWVDAVDGSEELCRLAKKHTGIDVRQMLFSELNASEEYDGIWACASILHLPSVELKNVILKMRQALKNDGWIYASFKHGRFEGMRNGRYFTHFTEESFGTFLKNIQGLEMMEAWLTGDARPDRSDEKWLNLILKKSDMN